MTKKKIALLNKVMSGMFCAVTTDDFITQNPVNKKFYLRGNVLTDGQVKEIMAEAQTIMATTLWKTLVKEMVFESNQRMFEKAKDIDDMVFGKAMLYCLDVMNRKLQNLSKLIP